MKLKIQKTFFLLLAEEMEIFHIELQGEEVALILTHEI